MRVCFLGQNMCGLGFGLAAAQAPALPEDRAPADDARPTIPLNHQAEALKRQMALLS
jgi:hypothetical protein